MAVPYSCRDAVLANPTDGKEGGKAKPHSLISACLFSEERRSSTTVRTQGKSGLKTVDLIVHQLSSKTKNDFSRNLVRKH